MRASVGRWAEASDETQEVATALTRSKEIISMFSNSVATGACAFRLFASHKVCRQWVSRKHTEQAPCWSMISGNLGHHSGGPRYSNTWHTAARHKVDADACVRHASRVGSDARCACNDQFGMMRKERCCACCRYDFAVDRDAEVSAAQPGSLQAGNGACSP